MKYKSMFIASPVEVLCVAVSRNINQISFSSMFVPSPVEVSLLCCSDVWLVRGCMVYTERAEAAAVSCGTSHVSAVS